MLGTLGQLSPGGLARETKVLALACAAVCCLYLFATLFPISVEPRLPSLSVGSGTVPAEVLEEAGDAEVVAFDVAQIQARPIFLKGRRPQVMARAPEAVHPVKEARPDIGIFKSQALVGIIEEGTDTRILLSSPGDGRTVLLGPGDTLGLWHFDRLEGETAIFMAGKEEYRLVLKERDEGANKDALVRKQTGSTRSRRKGRP